MSPDLLFVALSLGFASSIHCLGMCGGISAALANAAPARVRSSPWRLGLHLTGVHGGRIASYAMAGALAGLAGAGAVAAISQPEALVVLRYLAASFLVAVGFTVAGWLPLTGRVATWTVPIWSAIQRGVRRLAPVGPGSMVYGVVWGWMPCGMVYTTLFYAVIAGTATGGAAVMALFGLGTIPALLALGLLAGRLRLEGRAAWLTRQAAGVALVVAALVSVGLAGPDGPFCLPTG